MRTGAIFARGSCSALKWMALFGVVFALGAGSALAQITVTGPATNTVMEGDTAVYTVSVKGYIPTTGTAGTVTVTLALPTPDSEDSELTGEAGDISGNSNRSYTVNVPAAAEGATAAAPFSASGRIEVRTTEDDEAEDDKFSLEFTAPNVGGLQVGATDTTAIALVTTGANAAPTALTIKDDETQGIDLTVKPESPVTEGAMLTFALTPKYPVMNQPYSVSLKHDGSANIAPPFEGDISWGVDAGKAEMTTTLKLKADDGNAATDEILVQAISGTRANPVVAGSVSIVINDKTPMDYVTPKSVPEINAAIAAARGQVDDSSGKWMVGDDDIMIDLDDLFTLPDASMFTITAEAGQDDDDVVMATASAASNSVSVMAVGDGMSTVTVTVSANMKSSSATTRTPGRNSGSVTFDVTVDAPAPREPRVESTDAVITALDLEGSEQRTIGGVKRLHIDEGTRTEVSATVEWSVGQLREIYDLDSTPDSVVIRFGLHLGGASLPDWLSAADPNGDPSEDFGDDYWSISIKIPKLPAATKKDWERVEGKGSTPFNIHEDTDAEDEAFEIVVGSNSRGVSLDTSDSKTSTGQVVIDDDETQTVEIKRITKGDIYESGGDQEFEVSADPALNDLGLEVDFDLTNSDGSNVRAYGVSPSSDVIYAGGKAAITIDIDNSDGNRKDDELVLHADIDSRNRSDVEADTFKFTVIDVHKLPHLTVDPASDTVAEGGEIELTLTLDRNPSNTRAVDPETREYTSEAIDVMVDMVPEGIEITPRPVKFPKHNGRAPWTQEMKVEVTAKPNDDLDGERMVALTFEAAGTMAENGMGSGDGDDHMAVATLTIEDGTDTLVWARSPEDVEAAVMAAKKAGMGDDMMLTAGEMIELKGIDLFGSAQGVDVSYSAKVEGDAVSESVSGGVVTITADSMGMAKVTITARASRPSGAVMINDQTDPREASITIALEVGLVALSIGLSGPEDMNMVEGMDHANGTKASAMVTATANRKVTEDVTVTLMRDRAMSSADDMDFTAEPITIMAGQTTGSTMVMAVADDMMENEGNMAEELVLYGMAADNAGEVTGHVKFYIWDAAVPALPVIAQLLLAALMAVGGYRRYRRR